jgi:glycosyltransferase involved in cell wall biosynthesis
MRKKILFLTSHATSGGSLDYIFMLRNSFEEQGYETAVIAFYKGVNHDPRPGIDILLNVEKMGGFEYLRLLVKFFRLSLRFRPRVIIGVMPLANILGAIAGVMCRAKCVATHHAPAETQSRMLAMIDKVFGTLGLYSKIICVSPAVEKSFATYPMKYRSLMKVIRNGVRPANATVDASSARQQFGVAHDRPMLFMAGRLSGQKNVLNAVAAVESVDRVQLVLAGDGPLREDVEKYVAQHRLQEKVLLLGSIPKQDVFNLMHACDVFVQVSRYEGHSLALLEAVAAQTTMLLSDVPSQREPVTLQDGSVAAAFCDPTSPEDIARAMIAAAFDLDLRAQLATRMLSLKTSLRSEEEMLRDYSLELAALT